MKSKSTEPEMSSRRKFARSVATAFVVTPIVASIGTGQHKRQHTSNAKTKVAKKQEPKPGSGVRMEHIPPTLITAGSFVLETTEQIGKAQANTGSKKRKKKHSLPFTDVTGVRVVNIDGSVLFNGYNGTVINDPKYVDATGATIEIWLRDKESAEGDILIRKAQGETNLQIESDKPLAAPVFLCKHASNHPYKHEHPDDVMIRKVLITSPAGKELYSGHEDTEIVLYHVLIW